MYSQKEVGNSFTPLHALACMHMNLTKLALSIPYSVAVAGGRKKNHFSVNKWQNGAECVCSCKFLNNSRLWAPKITQSHENRRTCTSLIALVASELQARLLSGRKQKPGQTPGRFLPQTEHPMDLLPVTQLSGEQQ